MRKIHVSFGGAHLARVIEQVDFEWSDLVTRLLSPVRTLDKASAGWFCPVRFEPAYRDGANLVERHALTFDYDHVTRDDLRAVQKAYENWEYVIYTTWSHTAEKPRARIV
ncbi:MAG: hypothetical protein L0Z53_10870, partial [Acidobacteriales bacterium]|nr:hypothetical protein [Terriglobales bacterium]